MSSNDVAEREPGAADPPQEATIFGFSERRVFVFLLAVLLVPAAIFVMATLFGAFAIIANVYAVPGTATQSLLLQQGPLDTAKLAGALELDALSLRQQRSASLLSTRTGLRFMNALFGAILIVIGSAFVLGKVRATGTHNAEASLGEWKASFSSASPGLVLALLGAVLMAAPLWAKQDIQINDGASYAIYAVPLAASPGAAGALPLGPSRLDAEEARRRLQAGGG